MLMDILEKADLHISRAASAKNEIQQWGTLSINIMKDPEKFKTIDSFIYRGDFKKKSQRIGKKFSK